MPNDGDLSKRLSRLSDDQRRLLEAKMKRRQQQSHTRHDKTGRTSQPEPKPSKSGSPSGTEDRHKSANPYERWRREQGAAQASHPFQGGNPYEAWRRASGDGEEQPQWPGWSSVGGNAYEAWRKMFSGNHNAPQAPWAGSWSLPKANPYEQWREMFSDSGAARWPWSYQPAGEGVSMPFGAMPWTRPPWTPPQSETSPQHATEPQPPLDGASAPAWAGKPSAVDPLVALRSTGVHPPLLLMAAIYGSAFPYHQLVLHLDPQQPVYGLQSPALDGHTRPHATIEEIADTYLGLIKRIQPKGPYYLGGYSFGAWPAYEIATRLLEAGETIAFLGIIGASVPPTMIAPMHAQLAVSNWTLLNDQIRLAQDTAISNQQRIAQDQATPVWGTPLQRVALANQLAALRYLPRPIDRGLSLFLTTDCIAAMQDPTLGWSRLCTRPIDVNLHNGHHLNIFTEPYVKELAVKLSSRLRICRGEG